MQDTRHRRVEFWQAKAKKGTGGDAGTSEVPRLQRNVLLLRRDSHDDPGYGRSTMHKSGDLDGPRFRSLGPDLVDLVLLGGPDDYLELVNSNNSAIGDPLLLCEVGRDLGRDFASKQQGDEIKGKGTVLLDGPVMELDGELQGINKEKVLGHQKDCGLFDGSQKVESREVPQGEHDLTTGTRVETPVSIPRQGTGIEGISNSKWAVGSNIENVNFNDVAVKPNFAPPVGFTWEFLERGWPCGPVLVS